MDPMLLAITADRSAVFTTTVVISGISIVLVVLIVLILVFYAFGAIVSKSEAAAKKKSAKNVVEDKPTPKSIITSAPIPKPAVEEGIPGEVVAAISAAVVASEGPNVVIHSIKKKDVSGRNPWAQAATIDNTRPF